MLSCLRDIDSSRCSSLSQLSVEFYQRPSAKSKTGVVSRRLLVSRKTRWILHWRHKISIDGRRAKNGANLMACVPPFLVKLCAVVYTGRGSIATYIPIPHCFHQKPHRMHFPPTSVLGERRLQDSFCCSLRKTAKSRRVSREMEEAANGESTSVAVSRETSLRTELFYRTLTRDHIPRFVENHSL